MDSFTLLKNMNQSRDNILDDLLKPMNEALEIEEATKRSKSRVVILVDHETEEEETKPQEEYVMEARKSKVKIMEDDTPIEDFFYADGNETVQTGEIAGMKETDDEVNAYALASATALGLSISAHKFGDDLAGIVKQKSASIIHNKSETEQPNAEKVAEEGITEEQTDGSGVMEVEPPTTTIPLEHIVAFDSKSQKSLGSKRDEDLSRLQRLSRASQLSGSESSKTHDSRSGPHGNATYYEQESRFSEDDLFEIFALEAQDKLILLENLEEEVEEEEIALVVEEGVHAWVRDPWYQKYDKLSQKIVENRIKNYTLQKILVIYLKRRKVENFLRDCEPPLDQVIKYNQKLDAYEQILDYSSEQRSTLTEEINKLKAKRNEQSDKLDRLFKTLQTREEIGYGLIHTKTGNSIPNKVVERFIRRQDTQMNQVSMMRLKYIKLKGMVQEKLDLIDKLDVLENNLRLADYEDLKVENRNFADKMEEREEELTRLRARCQDATQVLAHMREKSSAFETDVGDLQGELEYAATVAEDLRAQIVKYKHERDKYRHLIAKIRNDCGLLIEPDLLRDMEASQQEMIKLEDELQACKEDVNLKTNQVRNLRKNIERLTETTNKRRSMKTDRSVKSAKTIKSNAEYTQKMIYSKRPTIFVPTIPPTAFKGVIMVKPNPATLSRSRR